MHVSKRICCSLSEYTKSLSQLENIKESLGLVIGPEGDLTPSEEQILKTNAFQFLTLGPLRLRSATAAIAAVSMIQALRMCS